MRGFFPFGCAQGQNDKQEQAKTKYRDSGFARMTNLNSRSRFPTGMTNKKETGNDKSNSEMRGFFAARFALRSG